MYEQAKDVIRRYYDGQATEEECIIVERWFHELNQEKISALSEDELFGMSDQIWDQLKPGNEVRVRRLWPQLAAACLLLFALSFGAYFLVSDKSGNKQNLHASLIHPGSNKAFLTLQDGRKVSLNDSKLGTVVKGADMLVTQSERGKLSYEVKDNKANAGEFNTLNTPKGGQYAVTLSDGTKVYLNAASSVRFPVTFHGKYRQVELTGEAYFEVKHDAARPFRVVSGNQVVEVLGTHFDVKSYQDEQSINTSLIEGSVRVRLGDASILLKPGQQAANIGGELTLTKVPAQNAIAWKDGFFRFKNDRIADIMKTLARWYDIDVDFHDRIGEERFSGQISRNKNIGDVLDVLEQTQLIHFEISGRRVIVKK